MNYTMKGACAFLLMLAVTSVSASDGQHASTRKKLAGTDLYAQDITESDRSAYALLSVPYLRVLGTAPGKVLTVADGRIQFIIDLVDDVDRGYVAKTGDTSITKERSTTEEAVADVAAQYGLGDAKVIASRISKTFSAALTPAQAERLSLDRRVRRMSPNIEWAFSADNGKVWADTTSGSEAISWGRNATAPVTPLNMVQAYVLDNGVALHEDLNVYSRYNINNLTSPSSGDLVGCYGHGTHIAGIMGALQNNKGSRGLFPNLQIVSVAMTGTGSYCSNGVPTEASIIAGLNLICGLRSEARVANIAVVNLSSNPPSGVFQSGTISSSAEKMLRLATSGGKCGGGAFIAQSAGNYLYHNSSMAYYPVSSSDGIMVVGALNDHGQPVVKINDTNGFRYVGEAENDGRGSNYGSRVEIWAPGMNIFAPNFPYRGPDSGPAPPTNTYSNLSGTSMAAPHVAGIAALLISTGSYATPSSVEQAIRGPVSPVMKNLGSFDKAGNSIFMGRMAALPSPASTPYSEIEYSGTTDTGSDGTFINDSSVGHYQDLPMTVKFGIYGAASCDLERGSVSSGTTFATSSSTESGASFTQAVSFLDPHGLYSPNCHSGLMNVSGRVAPTPFIYYDSQLVPVGTPPLGGSISHPVELYSTTGHTLTFGSGSSATNCTLVARSIDVGGNYTGHVVGGPIGTAGSLQSYFNSIIFGSGRFYDFNVKCFDSFGAQRNRSFFIKASV